MIDKVLPFVNTKKRSVKITKKLIFVILTDRIKILLLVAALLTAVNNAPTFGYRSLLRNKKEQKNDLINPFKTGIRH